MLKIIEEISNGTKFSWNIYYSLCIHCVNDGWFLDYIFLRKKYKFNTCRTELPIYFEECPSTIRIWKAWEKLSFSRGILYA